MVLNQVRIIDSETVVNIEIGNGKIKAVSHKPINDTALQLNFKNALAFPGLVNSHDHLDFNLFPALGGRIYNNYTEWGKYLHENYKPEIAKVLQIPAVLRAQWGVYKNMLAGVTTVVDHGEKTGLRNSQITIFESSHCLHSVKFQKNWRIKLNNPFKGHLPVNIHIGEGTDYAAYSEIEQLTKWNFLGKDLIGVHAVAMTENQAKAFKAVVWCPESNYFLLNKTAPVDLLKKQTKLLFGTDSTLTGNWNIWQHLLLARETGLLSDKELYETLTKNAADIWKLNSGEITEGKNADIVIVNTRHQKKDYDAFFETAPADILLVMRKGEVKLFDEVLLEQMGQFDLSSFSKIFVGKACKYIWGNLPDLMENIRKYNPEVQFPVSTKQPV